MIKRILTLAAFALLLVAACPAQNDLQIKKKISRSMPGGMGQIPTDSLPPQLAQQMKEINSPTTTVYVKGSWLRTDTTTKAPKMTGGLETHTFTTVIQCDKRRLTTFDTKSKKYSQYSMGGGNDGGGGLNSAGERAAKKGGRVTVSGTVTDTGERAKLFGFDARRVKQTLTFTPGADACRKQKLRVEVDGWYADLPEFSCPYRAALPEDSAGSDCTDDFDYQITGAASALTGVALKEIKRITLDGQTITMDEEATEITRTTLPDSFFDPPAGYKADGPLQTGQDDSRAGPAAGQATAATPPPPPAVTPAASPGDAAPLPLPSAGIERPSAPAEKRAGVVRIGIARPKVTTPESKKDPGAGADIAAAVTKSLTETLKAEAVEAVELATDSPAEECRAKGCDYIFYASVMQKRGGGGMFGKMLATGAMAAAGMLVPGVGGMIASSVGSVVMGQTMGKATKAKDEFTLEYKVTGLDDGAVLSQASTKAKAKEDGEDVLAPQLEQASKTVLGEIAKKKKAVSP